MTLEEAYRKYADELVGYATVVGGLGGAADAVADTFAKLLTDDARWASVRNERAFLYRSVLNTIRDRGRSSGRRRNRELLAYRQRSDHHAVTTRELLADPAVLDAVVSLSPTQRAVIYFAYWEDLPADAIADLLGVRPGTVKRQLARARARLRKVLQ